MFHCDVFGVWSTDDRPEVEFLPMAWLPHLQILPQRICKKEDISIWIPKMPWGFWVWACFMGISTVPTQKCTQKNIRNSHRSRQPVVDDPRYLSCIFTGGVTGLGFLWFFWDTSRIRNQVIMWNDMGVSKNGGTPKWMVYKGKPC